MICSQLYHIVRDGRALQAGARAINEPKIRPDYFERVMAEEFSELHEGLDASINHMMNGGNGFPDTSRCGIFDVACAQERRDLRSLHVWSSDFEQCKRDKEGGRTS